MERSDNSDRMAICRDICYSLLMLLLGLLFYFLFAMLTYSTYETIVDSRQFCTLWIDVPGRILIFLICYYTASICGFLPLPQRYHLRCFIVPFNVWSLRSWRHLFRNMCFSIPSRSLIKRLQRNVASVQENLETPLLQENNQECLYTCSPIRRRTAPINIPYPETYIPRVSVSNPETAPSISNAETVPINEIQGTIKNSNESITSINPSFGNIVSPIISEKSCNRHYMSEATIKESESPKDREEIPSKYRKRFTESKSPGEAAAGNALEPLPDYQVTTRERSISLTSDKKSRSLTDDERLVFSKKQKRRGLRSEMPELHVVKNIEPVLDANALPTDSPVANEQSVDNKYLELTDKEKLETTRQRELQISGTERLEVNTADERTKVLARNELLSKTNDKPCVHMRNLHLGASVYSNKREASPDYRNTEAHLSFPGTCNRNKPQELATGLAVAKDWPLDGEYFEVTAEESFATTRQEGLQISGDGRFKVLTRRELLPEMNDQHTVQKKNMYHGGSSCSSQPGALSDYYSIEAQSKFQRVHNRNQQRRGATASKEQQILSKLRSTGTQMTFPGTLGRNQQPDREASSTGQRRVARARNSNSLNFLRYPCIIPRNSKSGSARIKKLCRKHLGLVRRGIERYPVIKNRRQVYLYRSLERCVRRSLRSHSVTRTQLPRSYRNINLLAWSSFRIETFPDLMENYEKRIEVQQKTSSCASEGNVGLTTNGYNAAQKQGRVSMSFSHLMNLRRSLVDRATRRRRQLTFLRFHAYARTCPQIWSKTEVKRSVQLQKCRQSGNNSEHTMTHKVGPSNFYKLEDTKQTGMGTPVTGETANENFNRLQLDDLRKRLTLVKRSRTPLNNEASAAVGYKESSSTKTTNKTGEETGESNVSMKPRKAGVAKKPYVKITIDSSSTTSENSSDSDPERSK